jgi:glycerol kinase
MCIDQGTTSSRALLLSPSLQVVGISQKSHKQISENPGWTSHDPEEIYNSVKFCINDLLSTHNLKPSQIASIGITNQRETTVAWDRKTGELLYDGIVWHDKRNTDLCGDRDALIVLCWYIL